MQFPVSPLHWSDKSFHHRALNIFLWIFGFTFYYKFLVEIILSFIPEYKHSIGNRKGRYFYGLNQQYMLIIISPSKSKEVLWEEVTAWLGRVFYYGSTWESQPFSDTYRGLASMKFLSRWDQSLCSDWTTFPHFCIQDTKVSRGNVTIALILAI